MNATTLTRHASYDELVAADFRGMRPAVWAALRDSSGAGPDPAGAVPPVYGILTPAPTYLVPPSLGDLLLAALPPGDGLHLVDRRTPPAVTPDPARVAHRAPFFQNAVRAVVGVPRAVLTSDDATMLCPLAGILAEAFGPVGGVVLARDRRQAGAVAYWFRMYRVGHRVVDNRGALAGPAPPAAPGAWTIVPAGHPAWVGDALADPPVVIAVDPLTACHPRVLARLFAAPDQRVIGVVRTDKAYADAEVLTVFGYFGPPTHALERG